MARHLHIGDAQKRQKRIPPSEDAARRNSAAHTDLAGCNHLCDDKYLMMPWSFKAVNATLVIFVLGVALIAFACFESGWESIGHFAWGTLIAGVGLIGSLLFSIICAITQPAWRRLSLVLVVVSVLLLIGLFWFAKTA